ncbi:EF-hand domain-containing protein [Streptomyces sp. NPDC058613]|uniref:EF-hand domain-containing protein n=1 Tax=Streptomyces sp. NPDC058613 TaxID=3346556 RepID=UPI003655F319
MVSDTLTRKLDLTFRHLDANGDGVISDDDAAGLVTRMLTAFGESETSPKGSALVSSMQSYWEFLLSHADTNGDGVVDPAEFRTAMVKAYVKNDKGYQQAFAPVAAATVHLADVDNSGAVSLEEFELVQKAFNNPVENTREGFAKLDRNGDGKLSVEEYLLAIREFYTSDDPDATGNWLFGQV